MLFTCHPFINVNFQKGTAKLLGMHIYYPYMGIIRLRKCSLLYSSVLCIHWVELLSSINKLRSPRLRSSLDWGII